MEFSFRKNNKFLFLNVNIELEQHRIGTKQYFWKFKIQSKWKIRNHVISQLFLLLLKGTRSSKLLNISHWRQLQCGSRGGSKEQRGNTHTFVSSYFTASWVVKSCLQPPPPHAGGYKPSLIKPNHPQLYKFFNNGFKQY